MSNPLSLVFTQSALFLSVLVGYYLTVNPQSLWAGVTMMIIFLAAVQGVVSKGARCRRVAEDVDLQEHLMCFQSFCGRAASQALSEVCFVSPESLMQRQGKCRAIIPICPALLHMELALLNILN